MSPRVLRKPLRGYRPGARTLTDPLTFATVSWLLTAVATAACCLQSDAL
jgi:hypothetical protein